MNIVKRRYSKLNMEGYFNLGFGDKDLITGHISDLTVTNNGDSQKVLTTVAFTLYTFIDHHPEANVLVTGSTLARTRLYRMGITNNLMSIEKDFLIFGLKESNWEPFRKNITYNAFTSPKKIINSYGMKTKSTLVKKKIQKKLKVNLNLSNTYEEQPLFKDKIDRAHHILKTVGIPKI